MEATVTNPPPTTNPLDALGSIVWPRLAESSARRWPKKPNVPHVCDDGLRTPAEAARKLRCSIKTLNGHVASGALRYVAVGHGRKRKKRMFTDLDLYEFVANQTRKDSPCPSDATRGRRSGSTDSKSEVLSFSALRKRPRDAKPRK
jgi:hypothetical protein